MVATNENRPQAILSKGNTECVINAQLYEIDITLNNHTTSVTTLPKSRVLEMVIEEDLFDWPIKGYIVYNNSNEAQERSFVGTNIHNVIPDPDAFFFRDDCRDELNIKIKIKSRSNDASTNNQFTPNVWELHLNMIIYNMEDLPASNIRTKTKKIYFWDKRYQIMKEKKLQWSTATAQGIRFPSHVSDSQRAMYTGDAIQYMLLSPELCNFVDSIDNENWDKGAAKTFYTSPAEYSLYDDLQELLSVHVSTENDDFCILTYNNRVENKFKLMPMHKFFDLAGKIPAKKAFNGDLIDKTGAGPLALETFYFENITPVEKRTTPLRSPHNDLGSFEIDINIAEWNKITTYDYVDMAGIDNALGMVSRPVYSYMPTQKQFTVDYIDNEIETVRESFKELYIKKLAPNGSGDALITLNKTKTEQYNVDPVFSFSYAGSLETKKERYCIGKLKTLTNGVFGNSFISFTVNGSPHRTIGRFIAIEREDSDLRNKFDNKVCGQWLVTNVKHIWSFDRYINKIGAVKVNIYESNNVEEAIE